MPSLIRERAAFTPEMIAIFADEALLAHACRFETMLARAEAEEGLLSGGDAQAIAARCADPGIDIAALAGDAAHAGTLAIALVKHLRGGLDPAAAAMLHRGATSQDVADTALVLQARAGLDLLARDASRLCDGLAALARDHAATAMPGRTLLQPALPVTLGLKAANWLLGVDAAWTRLAREADHALMLQFGGAAGTLAGLDGKALAVAARLSKALDLPLPPMPWHARREGVAALGAALAILIGSVAKIARDVSLLAQAEVGEAREPLAPGRGGSSIMAHKRNPTGCQVALSAALRAPGLAATLMAGLPQEHERGLGGWQAEAPVLADLFGLAHGAVAAMLPVIEGLDVDAAAMRANLAAEELGADCGESAALVRRALDHYERKG